MINLPSNISVAWSPLKGTYQNGKYVMSSQELALTCPCDTVFMSSSRASGKTEVSLIMFAMNVGKGYGKYYKGVYLDLHYPDYFLKSLVKEVGFILQRAIKNGYGTQERNYYSV